MKTPEDKAAHLKDAARHIGYLKNAVAVYRRADKEKIDLAKIAAPIDMADTAIQSALSARAQADEQVRAVVEAARKVLRIDEAFHAGGDFGTYLGMYEAHAALKAALAAFGEDDHGKS